MKKLTYTLIIFTFSLFLFLNISRNSLEATINSEDEIQQNQKLDILSVNENQYKIIKDLVKDKHNVDYLVKNNEELKDYKIDDFVLENILNKDLLIYSDLENKDFIDKINEGRKSLRNKEKNTIDNKLRIINISRGIYPINIEIVSKVEVNPYYYLGINEYKIALYNIKIALQEKDIANRDYYERNYNELIKEIDSFMEGTASSLEKMKEYKILVDLINLITSLKVWEFK